MNILILGAGGQIARFAIELFLTRTDANLTLYLRRRKRLKQSNSEHVRVVEGDVLDLPTLIAAMAGQDVVYANLDGKLPEMARNIVTAMKETGVRRVIFISSMGIYSEVPGEKYRSILDPYRDGATVIEESGLDYTVVRPAWLNDRDEIDYETTQKGEAFKNPGATVSRKSVADLIVRTALTSNLNSCTSLGVNKPSKQA